MGAISQAAALNVIKGLVGQIGKKQILALILLLLKQVDTTAIFAKIRKEVDRLEAKVKAAQV